MNDSRHSTIRLSASDTAPLAAPFTTGMEEGKTVDSDPLSGVRNPVGRGPGGSHRALNQVRVLTWNVQNASPTRSRAQAAWLMSTGADVLALTEVSAWHDALAATLHGYGYATLCPRPGPGHGGDYRVLLACRGGTLEAAEIPAIARQAHRCATALLHLDPPNTTDTAGTDCAAVKGGGDASLLVTGLYVPSRGPRERRNADKRAFQEAVTAWLPHLAGTGRALRVPVVAMGDLNVVEPGHVPHHRVFGAWEYDFYASFAAIGLVDAYRHLTPDGGEHSWYGRRSGAGYRFDHLFLDEAHLDVLTGCTYRHQPRHQGLSDHAALTADLALPVHP